MIRKLALLVLIAGLSSCRTPPTPTPEIPQQLPEIPLEIYSPGKGKAVYRVDSARSRADIIVRRGGALARFGHDHVISATHMDGYVLIAAEDIRKSRADLRVDLESLTVDDPAARDRFGLDTEPTEEDIQKTAENMRGKVLQTESYPQAHLIIEITGGTLQAPEAQVTMYLHGEKHRFPISFETTGLETAHLAVSGSFIIRQTDYGMEPFSVLGGGLKVLDPVEIDFTVQADRLD